MNLETLLQRVSGGKNTAEVGSASYKTEFSRVQLEYQLASPSSETSDPFQLEHEQSYVQNPETLSHTARLEALLYGPNTVLTSVEVPQVPNVTFRSTGRVDYIPTLFITGSPYTYTDGAYLPLFEFLDEHTHIQDSELKSRVADHIIAYRQKTMKHDKGNIGRLFPISGNQFLCVEYHHTTKAGEGFGIYSAFVVTVNTSQTIEVCPVAKLSGHTANGPLPVLWEPKESTARVQEIMVQHANHPTVDMIRDVHLSHQNFHPEMIEEVLYKLDSAIQYLSQGWIAMAQFVVKNETQIPRAGHIKTVLAGLNLDAANKVSEFQLIHKLIETLAITQSQIDSNFQQGVQQVTSHELSAAIQDLQEMVVTLGKALENIQQLRYLPQDIEAARAHYRSIRTFAIQLKGTLYRYSEKSLGLLKGPVSNDHHFAVVMKCIDAVCAAL